MRKIVFAGGIQAAALGEATRAVLPNEDLVFYGTHSMAGQAAHRAIAAAAIVVCDVTDAGETVPEPMLRAGAVRILVPVVSGAFLWPYAGRPHPRNRGLEALPGGPYPVDFGDSFLDAMLTQGISEDAAVARYLALDVAGSVDLDGLLADTLDCQARLDAQTGFDIAGFVASRFRTETLFATCERLHLPLFRHVLAGVLQRIGTTPAAANAVREVPFEAGTMPIHPAVLRHFNMQVPSVDHRYRLLDEELFTFEQYCRRYVRFAGNEKLHNALALTRSNLPEVVPGLRKPLEVSPGSNAGRAAPNTAERAAEQPDLSGVSASSSTILSGAPLLLRPASQVPAAYSMQDFIGLPETAFSAMPEIMPPPPLRPLLPPELEPAPARPGLMAKLFGGLFQVR